MAESVYKVIELVGTSTESWEKAAAAAVMTAARTLHDLRIAEVVKLDMQIEDNDIVLFRARVHVSFKFHEGMDDDDDDEDEDEEEEEEEENEEDENEEEGDEEKAASEGKAG